MTGRTRTDPSHSDVPQAEEDDDAGTLEAEEEKEYLLDLLSLFGPSYARERQFWKACLFSCIPQGIILALIALAFFNFYTWLAGETWLTPEYEQGMQYKSDTSSASAAEEEEQQQQLDPSALLDIFRLGNGKWWYVGLLAGAGLAVGLVKVIWNTIVPPRYAFPKQVPSFLMDIRGLKAHNVFLPIPMLLCSALSIGLGAVCGPEAALGATGTAVGQVLATRWRIGKHQATICVDTRTVKHASATAAASASAAGEEEEERPVEATTDADGADEEKPTLLSRLLPDFSKDSGMCVMDGIAGAFGALFPTQYLAPMIILELGGHWGVGGKFAITETIARTGLAASIGYVVFTGLEDRTLLNQNVLNSAAYDILPVIQPIWILEGAVLGGICGLVGVFGLVLLAVGKKLGDATFAKLNQLGSSLGLPEQFSLGLLLTPVVGGTLVGLLCVAAPLILSDGADQLGSVVNLGKELGAGTVAVTGILKLAAVSISLGFGFIGGQIFPFLFAGTCVGTVAHLIYNDVPILISFSACFAAVPCAFTPVIFTFTTLASMALALGGAATAPIFVACLFSYTTVCGMGLVQDLIRKKLRDSEVVDTQE